MPFPILTSLIALPIAGAILLLFVKDDEHNEALADIGLESYLKMLLFDRFFHVRSANKFCRPFRMSPAACCSSRSNGSWQ